MRARPLLVVTTALLVTACAGSADDPATAPTEPDVATTETPATDAPGTSDVAADTTVAPSTTLPSTERPATSTTTVVLPPPMGLRFTPTGPEEIVFDWSEDACPDGSIPDIATRVVRNADGLIQLYIGHDTTHRMVGPDFDSLTLDCDNPVMTSGYDPDPSRFDDNEWLATTYTEDGTTVYGIVHNEYLGAGHPDERPGQCPSGDFFNCIDVSLTLAVSYDGGATFTQAAEPPDHLIATMPYVFDDEGLASGLWQTSNLVKRDDGYWYMLVNIASYNDTNTDVPVPNAEFGNNWICALRTDDVADPASWRYWDGEAFDGVFVNPYTDEVSDRTICAPVDFPALSAEMSESVIWVETIGKYVVVGGTYEPGTDQENWGIYYSTSDDLLDWSGRKILKPDPIPQTQAEGATMTFVAYPTLIDHDSDSPNFDTSDGEMYLYQTRFNAGGVSLDRDLVRTPVRIEEYVIEPTVWDFTADTQGWNEELDIAESTITNEGWAIRSGGDDPIVTIGGLDVPAQYDTITVTMSVRAPDPAFGQIFFQTEDAADISEERLIGWDIVADGQMRTYELDMSEVDTWEGTITALRYDPITTPDTQFTIQSITID